MGSFGLVPATKMLSEFSTSLSAVSLRMSRPQLWRNKVLPPIVNPPSKVAVMPLIMPHVVSVPPGGPGAVAG